MGRDLSSQQSPSCFSQIMKRKRSLISSFVMICAALYFCQMKHAVGLLDEVIESRILAEIDLKKEFTQQKTVSSLSTHPAREEIFWDRNRRIAESLLARNDDKGLPRKIITAYLEAPMNDTIPGTGDQGDPKREIDKGTPPEFYEPLPLRQNTPEDLKKYEYPRFRTCHDLPAKLPVDRGLQFDKLGNVVVHNVGNTPTPDDYPWQEAPYCPVDADPFLPWIHDIFPSLDGTRVEFVAQNKRRCKSGSAYQKDILRMTPQVALLQSVSVEVIDEGKARTLAPELWSESDKDATFYPPMPRYRLAPYEEASPEGMWTRFICRFHTTDFQSGKPKILKETLSEYPINYELAGYRKNRPQLLTPKGRETNLFWTSTLLFSCPIPPELQPLVLDGSTILSDGTPTLHVDVVPIRTSPRYGSKEVYFTEDMVGPRARWETSGKLDTFNNSGITSNGFNATQRWGKNHVVPPVEASGRWANLPICAPPTIPLEEKTIDVADNVKDDMNKNEIASKEAMMPLQKEKPHQLTACLWSAASFSERGIKDVRNKQKDTVERLREWIEFHLLVGFDHIVVYDNSGAHTNETSLEPITSQYPPSKVTRVDWPSLCCNNNVPGHPNTGERSSQYAAENSCRSRYGPYTEWMASFDTDEYLVPMGNYTNLKDVVKDAAKGGTNILTFRSTRGKLRHDFTREAEYHEKARDDSTKIQILDKAANVTFLEAYNCDSSPLPKPKYADRAKKQIYRTDYVLNHFVHYATVTKPYMEQYRATKSQGKRWQRILRENAPSERVTDEIHEAVMVHTKIVTWKNTRDTNIRCHKTARADRAWRAKGCYIGFPSPNGTATFGRPADDGMVYNCFINEKVENYWLPQLKERLERWH
ncbi:unnamed protein product [Cylindrotheca closterium]|uniref:Glycosyltransferase family 92 protein n=1 Tax=Cylindrotheca closterium TaxID=2856 RepID=A0AAD2CJM4_9STRA|nr:unnamed protein product [Cylindrotheca closterium]